MTDEKDDSFSGLLKEIIDHMKDDIDKSKRLKKFKSEV